ncbi:MAG TPA: PorP/SprF family type IX secretion system membrane protein [Bacteroidia bacterium]|nr:PorP/SprF family type IX secretion system membrane protein [Bacteroidia bacterium]
MNKIKLFLLGLVVVPFVSSAQDIHFSQISQTPLLLNPAQAGLAHQLMAVINYKDQWRSVSDNPFQTINLSGDAAFMENKKGSHVGLGVNFFSDKAGDGAMKTTTGQLHLSGVLAMNDNSFLSVGLYGGFGQRSLSYSKLYWDNQYIGGALDLNAPSMEPSTFANRTYVDVGAGVAWHYGTGNNTISSNDAWNVTVGFAVQHVNTPVYTYYGNTDMRLPMKFVAHGNGEIGIKNYSLVLEPGYLVTIQGGHHEINAGMLVKYWLQEASVYTGRKKPAAFVLGGYYRFSDALNVVAAYEMYPFRLGLSYDINLSNLTSASQARGGFEISLRFLMADDGKSKNKKFFN